MGKKDIVALAEPTPSSDAVGTEMAYDAITREEQRDQEGMLYAESPEYAEARRKSADKTRAVDLGKLVPTPIEDRIEARVAEQRRKFERHAAFGPDLYLALRDILDARGKSTTNYPRAMIAALSRADTILGIIERGD